LIVLLLWIPFSRQGMHFKLLFSFLLGSGVELPLTPELNSF
jgi:hypothetical protein